jgi:hypothetical protein
MSVKPLAFDCKKQHPTEEVFNMNITIEAATSAAAMGAASYVREQVFGIQCYRRLPRLDTYDPSQNLTLIARVADTNTPIAALSVVDTTGNAALHDALELTFPETGRVARFTQLAVLKVYRGMHIPARMFEEALLKFILPGQFTHTWLLFPADAARSSSFCSDMGFRPSARVFSTEYGRSRVLVRNEQVFAPELVAHYGPQYVNASVRNRAMNGIAEQYPCVRPQQILENEWLAH